MEENPYQSPQSEPPPPPEPPKRPPSRLGRTILFALDVWLGLGVSLVIVWEAIASAGLRPATLDRLPMWFELCAAAIVAIPFAAGVARWAWRDPESKWVCTVAIAFGISPFVLVVIGMLFFGLT